MRNKLYNPYIKCLYENRTKIKYGINDSVRGGTFITPALEIWCGLLIIVLRIMDFR